MRNPLVLLSSIYQAMSTTNNLRVAIVGGGVCGLGCAIALLKEGVDVHVYEAAVSESKLYKLQRLTSFSDFQG